MVCMIINIGKLVRTGSKGLNLRYDTFEVIEEHPEWKYLSDR